MAPLPDDAVVVRGGQNLPESLADPLAVHELASILAYLESLNAKKN
jgi:hypothetical protein